MGQFAQSGFRSIQRFTLSDYRRTPFADLEILEHKALPETLRATGHVSRWLEVVPRDDLEGITRIYICETQQPVDYLGYYLPQLFVIFLEWRTDFPMQFMGRSLCQNTLYHEIGHHACRHIDGGQDPEQEREADAYAARMMREAHPWMERIAMTLRCLGGKSRNHD